MTYLLLTRWRSQWDVIVILFANTAQENEETLIFAKRCAEWFKQISGVEVVWLEAVIHPEKGEGTTHKVVSFETASRKGEPFEAMIAKYGLPGPGRLHCTRELKANAMASYLRSIGWEKGSFDNAIGYRADEADRRDDKHVEKRIIYPLLDWLPLTKPHVNEFWMKRPFRLELTGYQGNCRWCWKKSIRKHMTLMSEDPSIYDFPERMDELYGTVGHEFDEGKNEYPVRLMFRGNLSTKDLRAAYEANKETLEKAEDDSIVLPNGELFPLDLEDGSCKESCDVSLAEAA